MALEFMLSARQAREMSIETIEAPILAELNRINNLIFHYVYKGKFEMTVQLLDPCNYKLYKNVRKKLIKNGYGVKIKPYANKEYALIIEW